MSRKTRPIIIGAIILIILIASVVSYQSTGKLLPFTLSGFTTLSLTSASFQSSSSYLNGQQFILYIQQGGLGQHVEGTFTPSEIQSKTGKQVQESLKISLDYSKQQCEYNIRQDAGQPTLYKYNTREWTCLFRPSLADAQSRCNSGDVEIYGVVKTSLVTFKCVCSERVPVANYVGYFDSPTVVNEARITQTIGTSSNSITIKTPDGTDRGTLGSNAYVIWAKNSVTGASCTTTATNKPIYQAGSWKIYSESAFNEYVSARGALEAQTTIGKTGDNTETIWNNIKTAGNNLNAKADYLLSSTKTFGVLENQASVTSSKAVLELTQGIQNPNFVLYVKADALKIVTPVAIPEISSAYSNCFRTGTEGRIDATIKNAGTEAGNIRVTLDCGSVFTATSQDLTLSAGASQTVAIPIYASTSQTRTTGTCAITATSIDKIARRNVGVCVEAPPKLCVPGEEVCTGGARLKCDSTGSSYTTLEQCLGSCVKTGATTQCTAVNPGGGGSGTSGGCAWYNPFCFFNQLDNLLTQLKWIVLIIASLFSVFYSRNFLEKLLGRGKENKIIAWVIAILIGVGIGIIFYMVLLTALFWWIIVGWIVFQIILNNIPLRKYFRR